MVFIHPKQIKHKHYVDFLVGNDILIECKAIEQIGKVFRLEKPVFFLFDVCNNDSYVIMAMASAEECTLKAKAIAIITGALQELQTSKSVLSVFFLYNDLRANTSIY